VRADAGVDGAASGEGVLAGAGGPAQGAVRPLPALHRRQSAPRRHHQLLSVVGAPVWTTLLPATLGALATAG